MEGLTLSDKEQSRLQILNGVLERYWSMREAAPLLGVSERQGSRLLVAYRKEGARGLVHKNRGRVAPNATPETIQQQVVALTQERYEGINHTQLTELLAEREGLMLSRPTVRRILVRAGLTSPRHRRPPQHRCRRQRMPQEGMLMQLDGSHHPWLEDRGPWLTLLLAVDDATGTAPHALFQEEEDTRGYLSLLQGIIERRGVPMAVYTDGHAVFQPRRCPSDLSQVPRKGPSTQWSRALQELGVTQILAHSPQAKARIHRCGAALGLEQGVRAVGRDGPRSIPINGAGGGLWLELVAPMAVLGSGAGAGSAGQHAREDNRGAGRCDSVGWLSSLVDVSGAVGAVRQAMAGLAIEPGRE